MKNFTVVCLLVAGLLMTACSPEPVLRLESTEGEKKIYQGMEYLYSEKDNSSAILAYYRHLDDQVIMDLEIISYSDTTFRVDASNVKFRAFELYHDGSRELDSINWEEHLIASGSAVNPEKTLLDIDKEASRVEARERTSMVLDGISLGLNIASDVAAAATSTPEEREYRDRQRMRQFIARAERREHFYSRVSSLNEQRHYWETEVLRTTDLDPQESVAGEIILPVVKDANLLEVTIETAGDVHRFRYRQRKFDP